MNLKEDKGTRLLLILVIVGLIGLIVYKLFFEQKNVQILCKSSSKFSLKKLEDITKYIKQKLPKLGNHLTEMKLNYEYFTTNWAK